MDRKPFALALLVALLAAGSPPAPAAAEDVPRDVECLTPAQTDLAVREGRIRPLATIAGPLGREILRARLCRTEDALVYRLILFDASGGGVRRAGLDARSGRLLYDGRR